MVLITPKVSVIFPIYNNEKYLKRCIQSVQNQTLKEIELILIDDGSNDCASTICDSFLLNDERVKVVHKENEGSAKARNLGLDMATGEYIAFVESDDYVSVDMYEKLYQRAKETGAEIIKCGFYAVDDEKLRETTFFYSVAKENEIFSTREKPRILMKHASMWAGIYSREFINRNNLRCILTPSATYSDFSWMGMTLSKAQKINVVHEALYYYTYDNPNSSRVQEGKKCYYKPFHCGEANRILKENNMFESVKEEIGYHEYRTTIGHAGRLKKEFREEYFSRLNALYVELTIEGFSYKYFNFIEKIIFNCVLNNQCGMFYLLVRLEGYLIKLMQKNKFLRIFFWRIKNKI